MKEFKYIVINDIEHGRKIFSKGDVIIIKEKDIVTAWNGSKFVLVPNGFYISLDDLELASVLEYPVYAEGEAVLYQNGERFELGIVKSICGNDEYFIYYHTGDTAARTHARNLHKITNLCAFHVIRLDPDDNERRKHN